MKFGGIPREENQLQLAKIWGQLRGLTAAEDRVTVRDTIAKAFARWCPAIHCPAAREDFSCSQAGASNRHLENCVDSNKTVDIIMGIEQLTYDVKPPMNSLSGEIQAEK